MVVAMRGFLRQRGDPMGLGMFESWDRRPPPKPRIQHHSYAGRTRESSGASGGGKAGSSDAAETEKEGGGALARMLG